VLFFFIGVGRGVGGRVQNKTGLAAEHLRADLVNTCV